MKRIVSILLATLLLLVALPAFAEGSELQAGLYTSENGDVLYLDGEGVGVLNFIMDDQFSTHGVIWTGSSLEIERESIPYTMVNGLLFFTFGGAVRSMSFAGEAEAYALGDQGTAFAGDYAAEDGQKLTLSEIYKLDDFGKLPAKLVLSGDTPMKEGATVSDVLKNSAMKELQRQLIRDSGAIQTCTVTDASPLC